LRVDIANYKGVEFGPAVILGNGPSLDQYEGKEFDSAIVGINCSYLYFPNQDYYVTVAYDRLADVASGTIEAKKAVITCLHKAHAIPDEISQKVAYLDMSLPDDYYEKSPEKMVFDPDISVPIRGTFGGILAIQSAIFLGFNPIYLVGFEGGSLEHCKKYPAGCRVWSVDGKESAAAKWGYIPPEYHLACHWHVYAWLEQRTDIKVYQTNPDAIINWYPVKPAPVR